MMLPPIQKVPAKFASYEARRRAALTAIAIELFRLEHEGKLPNQLESLFPTYLATMPEDPFDGENLRFEKLDRGFIVYSIGKDGEDNGGKEHARGSVEHTDITFTVER
jgi:hypothetical protein